MPDNSLFKIRLSHVLNFLYLCLILIIALSTYWLGLKIYNFLYPKTQYTEWANAELIKKESDDKLITSRAYIDAYLILKKHSDGSYTPTNEKLSDIQGKDSKIRDSNRNDSRQLCVYSVEVAFGYNNWSGAVKNIFDRELDGGWPKLISMLPKRRFVAPEKKPIINACRNAFSGTLEEFDKNAPVIRNWLIQDEVYSSHIEQGINQLADIANWENELTCESECDLKKSYVDEWRNYQLNIAEDPLATASESAEDPSVTDAGRSMPMLQASPVRGVYTETYSSLIFINAQGRILFIPFTHDNEIAIQRDVVSSTYGSTIYYHNAVTHNGITTLYASSPEIVLKSLKRSEFAVFGNNSLNQIQDKINEPVADYLQKKTNEMIDAAIAENSLRAKQNAKTILSQKLSMLKTVVKSDGEEKHEFLRVKYTDIAPDSTDFSESNLTRLLHMFDK